MQSTEVVDSLRNIRGEVEAHLRNVKEYRAFLSIQAAMDEIAHVGELHSPLEGVREGVRQRLNELREYRALLAVEKSITDIADVLGLLDEIAPRPVASPAPEPAAVDAVATEVAVTAVTAEVTSEEQLVTAPSEPAPQPAEAAVATEAAEAVPAPTEVVAAAAPSEAQAVTTPAEATAEIPATEADASQAVDIVVPAELLADAAATSEVAPIHAEQDFDPQHVVPAAASVQAAESPIPLVAAESNPEGAPSDFGSAHAQQESHQTVTEDDQVIAKVA
jgi:hypothetical protein